VMEILSRRKKNKSGADRGARRRQDRIVEGWHSLIAGGSAPTRSKDHRVLSLDMAGRHRRYEIPRPVRGASQGGHQRDRAEQNIHPVHRRAAYASSEAGAAEGAVDASNMLKPALARGELQCVGASTLNEYRKIHRKDGALERRFQTVIVDPPTVDETIEILKGLRKRYEDHHRVIIPDEDADRGRESCRSEYITDRFLPDKAIDVIDEAVARARLAAQVPPPEVAELKDKLESLSGDKEAAVRDQNFGKAASLSRLRARVAVENPAQAGGVGSASGRPPADDQRGRRCLHRVALDGNSGHPAPGSRNRAPAGGWKTKLHESVVGQNEAIPGDLAGHSRSRAGLKDSQASDRSFIFQRPTGVGKTELARALARFLFADAQGADRVDMSEYMESFR